MTEAYALGFIPPMRFLSTLALLLTAAVLPAQEFDFKGVPADYAFTFATAGTRGLKISDSPEAKAFKSRVEKLMASVKPDAKDSQRKIYDAIKAATGIDLDNGDLTFAGGFSLSANDKFTGGLILRTRHDRGRLAAHAAAKKLRPLQAGDTPGWDAQEFMASLDEELAKSVNDFNQSEPIGLFDVDSETIVIAQPKEAARIIGLAKGRGVSYALPANVRSQLTAVGRPYVVMSVNAAKLPASAELAQSGFVSGLFAMGEKGSDQVMKVSANFTSKEKAAPLAMQAQGMLAMAPMMLAGDPTKPETAEEKEMKALAGEFLAGIQPVDASGSQITMTAKWDTLKLLSIIEKLVEMGAKKAKDMPAPAKK